MDIEKTARILHEDVMKHVRTELLSIRVTIASFMSEFSDLLTVC